VCVCVCLSVRHCLLPLPSVRLYHLDKLTIVWLSICLHILSWLWGWQSNGNGCNRSLCVDSLESRSPSILIWVGGVKPCSFLLRRPLLPKTTNLHDLLKLCEVYFNSGFVIVFFCWLSLCLPIKCSRISIRKWNAPFPHISACLPSDFRFETQFRFVILVWW
jgi:hypothetical protein